MCPSMPKMMIYDKTMNQTKKKETKKTKEQAEETYRVITDLSEGKLTKYKKSIK